MLFRAGHWIEAFLIRIELGNNDKLGVTLSPVEVRCVKAFARQCFDRLSMTTLMSID